MLFPELAERLITRDLPLFNICSVSRVTFSAALAPLGAAFWVFGGQPRLTDGVVDLARMHGRCARVLRRSAEPVRWAGGGRIENGWPRGPGGGGIAPVFSMT